jgi:hypothetical protein
MVAQVITVVTVLTGNRLRFFIGENISAAFKAVNSPFPDNRYSFLFSWENNLFNVDMFIAMETRH